ncbi:MAG TPA: hypothetical protein VGF23_25160 [Gaiellaceae bacterium]|jgi:hypothetical protein
MTRERVIEWATRTLTQGELLDAFAAYCDELDDVTVVERTPTSLRLDWRGRETSRVELADALPAAIPDEPLLLLAEIAEGVVTRLLDDAALRSRVAVYDPARLQKINAVRSSTFVYFEWFLRDVYGVKVLSADAFTQGLVERGIISLGMG